MLSQPSPPLASSPLLSLSPSFSAPTPSHYLLSPRLHSSSASHTLPYHKRPGFLTYCSLSHLPVNHSSPLFFTSSHSSQSHPAISLITQGLLNSVEYLTLPPAASALPLTLSVTPPGLKRKRLSTCMATEPPTFTPRPKRVSLHPQGQVSINYLIINSRLNAAPCMSSPGVLLR